jgi:hypothetical protein
MQADPPVNPCPHAIVRSMVKSVTGNQLTILARDNAKSVSEFDISKDDVWWDPHPHCPPSVRCEVGDVGNLYLHRRGWDACRTQGAGLYGYDPANPDPHNVLFKYPNCSFSEALQPLAIRPTSIVVVTENDRIELAAPEFATAQALSWDSLSNFAIKRVDGTELSVWPLQLLITGKPADDEGDEATVDVLDRTYAALMQNVSWSSFGDPIEAVLRPRAFYLLNAEF